MDNQTKLIGWTVFVASVSSSMPILYNYMTQSKQNRISETPLVSPHHGKSNGLISPIPTPVTKQIVISNNDTISKNPQYVVESPSSYSNVLSTGHDVVAHVGYALSDLNFVFPLTPSAYLGQSTFVAVKDGLKNCFNEVGYAVKLHTRAGTSGTVRGALQHGALATVYTSSDSLTILSSIITNESKRRYPLVIHCSSLSVDRTNLEIQSDMSKVMKLRDSNAVIIVSSTVQEAHDVAIIAHILALDASIPVVHSMDGVRSANEYSKISLLSNSEIASLVDNEMVSSHRFRATGKTPSFISRDKISDVAVEVMTRVSAAVGRSYLPFEYTGATNAVVVVVVMGSGAPVVEEVIKTLVDSGKKIGCLRVRVYRPWSFKMFTESLPSSVKRVTVLEQVASNHVSHQPLFYDVSASISSAKFSQSPLIVGGVYSSLNPSDVINVISNIEVHSPLTAYTVSQLPPYTSGKLLRSIASMFTAATKHGMFWGTFSNSSVNSAKSILSVFASSGNLHGSCVSAVHPYRSKGISTSQIRVSPYDISNHNYDSTDVDYVSVSSIETLVKYDVVKGCKQGGVLVLNVGENGEELQNVLSNDFKKSIASKSINLFTVDASNLSSEAGLSNGGVGTVMAAAYLRFFDTIDLSKSVSLLKNQLRKQFSSDLIAAHLELVDKTIISLNSVGYPKSWKYISLDSMKETKESKVVPSLMGLSLAESNFASIDDTSSVFSNSTGNSSISSNSIINANSKHRAFFNMIFPEEFGSAVSHRPTEHEKSWLVPLTKSERLTPLDYDRNVFHLEFDTSGTDLTYKIGDALGVYAPNNDDEVEAFLNFYELNPLEIVALPRNNEAGNGMSEMMTIQQLFTQYLDLWGRPSKRFYKSLVDYATDCEDKYMLSKIADSEYGSEEFKKRVDETYTFADILFEFSSARPPLSKLLELIPPIMRRHYSIASSQKMHPTQVHLLVVLVEWTTPSGKRRQGQATRFLSSLKPNRSTKPTLVSVSVMSSVLRLPSSPEQPVIMAGLGTGMAPFRAFIEERAYLRNHGVKVGPMILYFGSRYRSKEWLYGEELEQYEREGLVSLRLAFSRDTAKKVYIQHKIQEDANQLNTLLDNHNRGHFYLCGPTWPVPDVEAALVNGFIVGGGLDNKKALEYLDVLREEGRHVLEVY